MFRRRNRQHSFIDDPSLMLRTAGGTPLCVFPSEQVRSFRRMVTQLWYNGGFPQRLAVVSALRGEGVTLTVLTLAATLANDVAAKVCAVELNWWSPGMVQQLAPGTAAPIRKERRRRGQAVATMPQPQLASRPAFAEVLLGSATLEEALIATNLPNLMLLPAGTLPSERRPALARSAELRTHIEQLNARFDHLILDIPAVLTTSDAIGLASLATAGCVVVRHGVTATSDVQSALDDLKHLPMLGVVLNQATYRTPSWLHALIPQE